MIIFIFTFLQLLVLVVFCLFRNFFVSIILCGGEANLVAADEPDVLNSVGEVLIFMYIV